MQPGEKEEDERGALSFSEAMDMAVGGGREKVLEIVNLSTVCLFALCLAMLYMTYGDDFVFNLLLGFLVLTCAFAAAFNWTMAMVKNTEEEPQEADERGAVEDKKEK
ncbi:hypothetical protein Esti_000720 [Eimeria stiedai]